MKNEPNIYPLKEAIEEFLKFYRLEDKLKERKVLDAYPEVVGELIMRHTLDFWIWKKTLYIKVDSAPLRNELMMARTTLMRNLNKKAGAQVIEDIVLR
jgi:hypothetical protein